MYMEPQRGRVPTKARKVAIQPVPPPIGGWNARDPLPAMAPTDALRLDNFTPMDGGVELRPGSSEHAHTIAELYIETQMQFSSPTTTKLFAAAEDKIYDITNSGAAVSSLTGLDNGRWEWVHFTIPSASRLACVNNSADGLKYYDGSGWSTSALSGTIDDTKLAAITVHMNRVWLAEDNSLDVYYLDLQAITGPATQLATSSQFTKGGKVLAMASWTRDGGSGMDDVLAIISSNGEVLIYSGTDPDVAASWSKVGLFSIPRPIQTRRCAIKFGGDVAILTVQGLIPMSEILQRASSAQSAVAITDKIKGAFATAASLYGNNWGWQVIEYHRRGLLLINVPISERSESHQYVMNVKTGAWCRWKGLDASCWGIMGDDLYSGRPDGEVHIMDQAFDDVGVPIDGLCVQAYNAFGDPSRKRWVRFQPQMHKPENYRPLVDVLLNYTPDIPAYSPPQSVSTGWVWDVTAWEDLTWGSEIFSTFDWLTIRGHGVAGALVVAVSSDSPLKYNGGLVAYEPGGMY